MAETKYFANEATVGLAQESRDYINRVTDAYSDAAQRWVDAGSQIVPAWQPDGFKVPNPKDLLNSYFDLAEQVLGAQRKLVEQAFDQFGKLASTDEKPAYEKAAEQATNASRQAFTTARPERTNNAPKAEVKI